MPKIISQTQQEEAKPKTSETPHPKDEKYEKHEKKEKQEKGEHEKHEKYEKHEKREIGISGSIIAGFLLVILGLLIFFARWYNVPELLGPLFLIIVGIAIIVYAIIVASVRRKTPVP